MTTVECYDLLTEDDKAVLRYLCAHDVNIDGGYVPLPSTWISKVTGFTLYKTRKTLKRLKEYGFVCSGRYGGQSEDGRVFCINGYNVTKKAKYTEEYRVAYAKERELCKECFDIDIGELRI